MKPRFLSRTAVLIASALLAAPTLARAHPGHDDGHELTWDFTGGFGHPFGGLDHLLAMLAVGFWAMQLGGRARWAVPLTFIAAMTLGAALGRALGGLAGIEQALAASVLVLGLLVAGAARLSLWSGLPLVASFALVHGLAHGAEIPAGSSGLGYGAGFLLATAAVLAAALAGGQLVFRKQPGFLRAAGLAVMVCGIGFCLV